MTTPSSHEIAVAAESLRAEARVWEHQSEQLAAIARRAEGLQMGRLEAGLFQLMLSAYNNVADQVTARCQEGQQRMTEIAATLRQVADTYEDEDRDNAHRIHNLY